MAYVLAGNSVKQQEARESYGNALRTGVEFPVKKIFNSTKSHYAGWFKALTKTIPKHEGHAANRAVWTIPPACCLRLAWQ